MQITITATLTPEQLSIISQAKGYVEGEETMESFVSRVYTNMVAEDASRVFIEYSCNQKAEEIRAEEQAIRDSVNQSISSSIV